MGFFFLRQKSAFHLGAQEDVHWSIEIWTKSKNQEESDGTFPN